MSAWNSLDTAPRDRDIWLFLPSAEYQADEHGRPVAGTVRHKACVARWNAAVGAWIARDGGRHVFPSMWHDADVDGPMPDNHLLHP